MASPVVVRSSARFPIRLAVALAVLPVLALVSAFWLHSRPAAAHPAASSVDPRLILHPHATSFRVQAGPALLRGSIRPSIPGKNSISLRVPSGTLLPPKTVRVSGVMVGMTMPPVSATLHWRHGAYRGTINLSMFGRYRLFITPRGGAHGQTMINMPVPRF